MTDLAQLEAQTLAAIEAAERRSGAGCRARQTRSGKKGSISALAGDARQNVAGRAQDRRREDQRAQGSRRRGAGRAQKPAQGGGARPLASPARPLDVTCRPAPRALETGRIHPISQVMDELTAIFADMGFSIAEGPDVESDDLQFHQAEFPARPSGARNARHLLLQPQGRRHAQAAAHPHLAGAGAHHAEESAADPRDLPRAAPIAAIPTRPTRRCSIRSKAW